MKWNARYYLCLTMALLVSLLMASSALAAAPQPPPGGLVYDEPFNGTIATPSSTQDFTLDVDADQTITVVADPAAGLRPRIDLLDPSSATIGSAWASAEGQDAVLQTIPVTTAGTYTITISGMGTTGDFDVRAILNAAVENETHDGPANDTRATAQDVDASFLTLTGDAERGAVLGSLPTVIEEVEPNDTLGTAQSIDEAPWSLAADPNIAYATTIPHVTIDGTGDDTFDVYSFTVPIADVLGIFDIDFGHIPGASSGNVDTWIRLYDSGNNLLASNDDSPTSSGAGGSVHTRDSYIEYTFPAPGTYAIEVGRWSSGNIVRPVPAGATYQLQVSLENHPLDLSDFYRFSLDAGERATLVLKGLDDSNADLELQNASGTVLATGAMGVTNVDRVVADFETPATGTYYVRVSGSSGDYSLVLTRNAAFDAEPNDSLSSTQDISATYVALGSTAYSSSSVIEEVEPNDTLGTAQNIDAVTWSLAADPNIVYSTTVPHVTIDGTGDGTFDYYSFTIPIANTLGVFDIDFGSHMGGHVDSYLHLYNSDGTLLASNDDARPPEDYGAGGSVNGQDSYLEYTFTATGAYAIRVGRYPAGDPVPAGATYQLQVSIENHPLNLLHDFYSFPVAEGKELHISTLTPAGGPFEFVNDLDPAIELYDPTDTLVATDDNSAADGRNAQLAYTAAATGIYKMQVLAAAGNGEYVLVANTSPTAVDDDTATTPEDTPVTINVLANDSDPNGDALSVVAVGTPVNGGATTSGTTAVIYTPTLNFNGTDTFTYTISDTGGLTDTAMVTVTVTPVNDAPTVSDVSKTGNENATITFVQSDFTDSFTDVDGDSLTKIKATSLPSHGTLNLDGNPVSVGQEIAAGDLGNLTYEPNASHSGADSFGWNGSDGMAYAPSDAQVNLTITDVTSSIVLTKTADPTEVAEPGGTVTFTVRITNISAVDSVTIITLTDSIHGDLDSLGTCHVPQDIPSGDYYECSFTATVSGNAGDSETDTVTAEGTDDDGNPATADDTATVTIAGPAPAPPGSKIYLPIILNNSVPPAPDLVVENIIATSNSVQVVIKNQGDTAVLPADEFWVDLYINPDPIPTGVNQIWNDLCDEGLVWGVTADALPLAPGDVITLTIGDAHYWPDYSKFSGSFPAGTPVYAQVDSANTNTTYGAVLENHEITGGPYNNISGPVYPTNAIGEVPAEAELPVTGDHPPASSRNLPPRP